MEAWRGPFLFCFSQVLSLYTWKKLYSKQCPFDDRGVLTYSKSKISLSAVWDVANVIIVIQTSKEIRSYSQGNRSLLEILLAAFNYAVLLLIQKAVAASLSDLEIVCLMKVHAFETHQIKKKKIWIVCLFGFRTWKYQNYSDCWESFYGQQLEDKQIRLNQNQKKTFCEGKCSRAPMELFPSKWLFPFWSITSDLLNSLHHNPWKKNLSSYGSLCFALFWL